MRDAASQQQGPVLDATTFEHIRRVVHQKSGISLKGDKMSLVTARLARRLRELGLDSFRAYVRQLEADATGAEMTFLLDAISTNVTYFFREADHFDLLKKVIGEWQAAGQQRFRIWSAACSTGEEPYTLAMSLADTIEPGTDLRILATDISTHALSRAMAGVYAERAIESIPAALRSRFLRRVEGGPAGMYSVDEALRRRILYRHLNLIDHPLPMNGPLDVILCRNVMIYFDNDTRAALVAEFHRLLRPGGLLIVSHSESLIGVRSSFRLAEPSIYVRLDREGAT